MKIVKLAVTASMITMATGCTSLIGEDMFNSDKGRILISSDAEGMRSFGDMLNGMITNGKQTPDTTSSHYLLRMGQENELTKRQRGFTSYAKASNNQTEK